MKYTKIIRKETKVMVLVVALLLVAVLGMSYAFFMRVDENADDQVVTTGTLEITYQSTNGYITNDSYDDILPMSNNEGLALQGYNFSVRNTGNLKTAYQVYLYIDTQAYQEDYNAGRINKQLFNQIDKIKYNIRTNNTENNNINYLNKTCYKQDNGITKYSLYSGNLNKQGEDTHTLRIWLDESLEESEINKYIYLKLEVISYVAGQENEELTCPVTITLDANGGSVSPSNVVLFPGENYGNLPTPTRDGYTFKGWNGKNLFNLNVPESLPSDTNYDVATKRTFTPNTYVVGLAFDNYFNKNNVGNLSFENSSMQFVTNSGYGVAYPFHMNFSNKYTLSYSAKTSTGNPIGSVIFYKVDGSKINYILTNHQSMRKVTFEIPNETYYLVLAFVGSGLNNTVTFSDIQLEEGTEATAYEPYYIQSNTPITRDSDHTLTAIWEANS